MIIIIHGDNIAASRSVFLNQKKEFTHPLSLRGGDFTLTDLTQIFEGGELFQETKSVFIEDLYAKVKKKPELSSYLSYLYSQEKSHTIVLWEGKLLTQVQLSSLKEAKVELYKLPTSLFTFLDALLPGNAKQLIAHSHKVMADVGDEMLISMLIRQVRLLLALKEKATIEEVKRLAPWQKSKLENQSKHFSTEQLVALHQDLFRIDNERKTGENTNPLPVTIDFLLAKI